MIDYLWNPLHCVHLKSGELIHLQAMSSHKGSACFLPCLSKHSNIMISNCVKQLSKRVALYCTVHGFWPWLFVSNYKNDTYMFTLKHNSTSCQICLLWTPGEGGQSHQHKLHRSPWSAKLWVHSFNPLWLHTLQLQVCHVAWESVILRTNLTNSACQVVNWHMWRKPILLLEVVQLQRIMSVGSCNIQWLILLLKDWAIVAIKATSTMKISHKLN